MAIKNKMFKLIFYELSNIINVTLPFINFVDGWVEIISIHSERGSLSMLHIADIPPNLMNANTGVVDGMTMGVVDAFVRFVGSLLEDAQLGHKDFTGRCNGGDVEGKPLTRMLREQIFTIDVCKEFKRNKKLLLKTREDQLETPVCYRKRYNLDGIENGITICNQ